MAVIPVVIIELLYWISRKSSDVCEGIDPQTPRTKRKCGTVRILCIFFCENATISLLAEHTVFFFVLLLKLQVLEL